MKQKLLTCSAPQAVQWNIHTSGSSRAQISEGSPQAVQVNRRRSPPQVPQVSSCASGAAATRCLHRKQMIFSCLASQNGQLVVQVSKSCFAQAQNGMPQSVQVNRQP
jgi:hypothetical protein